MRILLAALLVPTLALAAPHHSPQEQVVLAPGYSALTFEAPEPGSYRLPSLRAAADGVAVNEDGRQLALHDLLGDRFVLLSFIYTSCSDVNGCPLASYVLKRVQDRILQDEDLAGNVRLLSLSFDRINDSPAVMAQYGSRFRAEGFDWRFLTTPDDGALAAILDGYDQYVIRDVNEQGETIGSISHILRVYLIDRQKQVRNIYSVSFLHPDIILGDIRTLMGQMQE